MLLPLWVIWGHHVHYGYVPVLRDGLEEPGSKQLLQSKLGKKCVSSVTLPVSTASNTGTTLAMICEYRSSTSGARCFLKTGYIFGDRVRPLVTQTSLYSRLELIKLFFWRMKPFWRTESNPVKQKQNKSITSSIYTKMSLYDNNWIARLEQKMRLIAGNG